MDGFFRLSQHGTTASKEILCGTTTFLTMSYILFVNPVLLAESGMPFNGVFAATALTAALCSIFMGLFANTPFGMAPGMGLNSFFTYVMCAELGFHWREALAVVFLGGILHIILMLSKARKSLVNAMPRHLKLAFGVGLGIFIGYTGLKSGGFLMFTSPPGQYQVLQNGTVLSTSAAVPSLVGYIGGPQFLALTGLALMLGLLALEKKTGESYGALPVGILTATFVGIPLNVTNLLGVNFTHLSIMDIKTVFFAFWGDPGLLSLLTTPEKLLPALLAILILLVTNITDSIGTIIGTGQVRSATIFTDADLAAFSEKKAETPLDKTLICNASGGCIASLMGTTTATTYMESITGIAAGGRTGLSAVTVGGLFLLCLPLGNVFRVIPAAAIAPALIIAGAFMVPLAARINWDDFEETFPAFATIMCIPLTYSFAHGIAAGVLSHIIIQVGVGKWRAVHPLLYVIALIFIFVVSAETWL